MQSAPHICVPCMQTRAACHSFSIVFQTRHMVTEAGQEMRDALTMESPDSDGEHSLRTDKKPT